ncbi:olfactory receptor 6B1-like [Xenopus tropicalis]|uniref:Olfactory receptor n=1 Tax=Xenopus tropicalis TaxID=8364 RepID=A0A8J1IS54_XENTR|nr:olfactory receptor 6B1-like [Xenopus tropicalis]
MGRNNQTFFQQIVLSGFQVPQSVKIPFFLLLFISYSVALSSNVTILTLVSSSPSLHHPMFFFLSHLSLSDIILTTSIVPTMLHGILRGELSMPIPACITQLQFLGIALTSECFILAVMSYDRYLAICNPFHYISVMDSKFQIWLVVCCWVLSFLISFLTVIFVSKLEFCGFNVINHFFCDFAPLLQLSCSDTSAVELENLVVAIPTTLFPVLFITATYICIFVTILRIPSITGRQKAFSTCSSHLSVVAIFFGTLVALYVVPSNGHSLTANKVLSLLYTVITPLFNPMIYCLRNKEIKAALKKLVRCVCK